MKIFLALIFLSIAAIAQTSVSGKITFPYQKEKEDYQKRLADMRKNKDDFQRLMDNCLKAGSECSGPQLQAIQAGINKAQADIMAFQEGLDRVDSLIDKDRVEAEKQKDDAAFERILKLQGYQVDFSKLRGKASDVEAKLLKLENTADRQAIGVYMQNKILALMNSQVMCSAVARCTTKDKQIIDKKRMKEIFPDMDPENLLSGDKYHSRALQQMKSDGAGGSK